MARGPKLLRLNDRRGFRRSVYLCALVGLLVLAPSAGGIPGDPTPPVVTPVYSPAFPANGWFRSNVTLNWSVIDPESIILSTSGCESRTLTADTAGTQFTCTAVSDGGMAAVTRTIRIDKTVPSVAPSAVRGPDANGWYNRALSVGFAGTDTTSGIASCSPTAQYAGPDNPSASVVGSCTDHAGNVDALRPRVQVRLHPTDLVRGDCEARQPQRADHVAEVDRYAGCRRFPGSGPSGPRRVRCVPRIGDGLPRPRPHSRAQVRVPGDRQRPGNEPRRATHHVRRNRPAPEPCARPRTCLLRRSSSGPP